VFRIRRNTFYDWKNKIPVKIPEFNRSGIGLPAEFCRIPNGFPNQGGRNPGTVLTAEDYGNGASMVLGEGKKPSGEEVSFSLQSTPLLKGTKDGPTNALNPVHRALRTPTCQPKL
jgi:hypothetical protein